MEIQSVVSDTEMGRRSFLKRFTSFGLVAVLTFGASLFDRAVVPKCLAEDTSGNRMGPEPFQKVTKTDDEWRRILTPEQFRILRKKGTEPAFSGQYHDFKGQGIYQCVACNNDLFNSKTKFASGTGWPSFWAPFNEQSIRTEPDYSLFMKRVEVLCNRCGGHLGHVFDDGPPPTGLRYCINSVALQFVPKKGGRR